MDLNLLLKSLKMDLGMILKVIPDPENPGLPLQDPDKYLKDILDTKTMPTLSIVYPYFFKIQVSKEQLIPLDEIRDDVRQKKIRYRIPLEVSRGYQILYIRKVFPIGSPMNGMTANNLMYPCYSNTYHGRPSSSTLYQSSMMASLKYAEAQLAGTLIKGISVHFEHPNIVHIDRMYAEFPVYEFDIGVKHDDNLLTIPDTALDEVKKLAILDIRSTIYNQYKLYDSLGMPFGNLNLKLDDWSGAEAEREEFYNRLLSTSHYYIGTITAG